MKFAALLLVPLLATQINAFDLCGICTTLVNELKSIISSSSTIQDVDNEIAKVCQAELGSGFMDELCKDGLDAVAGYLLKDIQNGMSAQAVCADVHLCSGASKRTVFHRAMLADSPLCTACKGLIGTLDQELTNPTVSADIEKEVMKVCMVVPSGDREMCQNVISNYWNMLWTKIVALLSADSICSDLQLCSASWAPVFRRAIGDGTDPWNQVECNFCTMLFNFVEQNLVSSNMQTQLENELKQVCNMIPNTEYQQKCVSMLDKYAGLLFTELQGIVSPSHMCPILHMCSSS
jgi:hypothetical protein